MTRPSLVVHRQTSPGKTDNMSLQNQNSWKEKWGAQMDKAHTELQEIMDAYALAKRAVAEVEICIAMQLRLMEIIDSQIEPPG